MSPSRYVIPGALGLGFAAMALLHAMAPETYLDLLSWYGFHPFPRPFIDTEAITSAIECARRGIDVYVANPCDPFGRPHVYSPLWLALPWPITDAWTMPVGLVLDLLAIASLALLPAPRGHDGWILVAACLSYMPAYALERGNNDLVVLILVLLAARLFCRRDRLAWTGHALMLLAGLLKFYPLAALAMLLRETPKAMLAMGLGAIVLVGALAWSVRTDLAVILSDIPHGLDDMFGARHFSISIADLLATWPGGAPAWAHWIPGVVLVVLALTSLLRLGGLVRLADLHAGYRALAPEAAMPMILGSIMVTGCFFTGESMNYRGVLLLPVLAGLLALRRASPAGGNGAAVCREAITLILVIMWAEPLRHLAYTIQLGHGPFAGAFGVVNMIIWALRECLWWRLVTILLALLFCFAATSPSVRRRAA
jgi:hypothetical protein